MNNTNFVINEESAKFIEPKHESDQNNKKHKVFVNIFLLLTLSLALALIGIFLFFNYTESTKPTNESLKNLLRLKKELRDPNNSTMAKSNIKMHKIGRNVSDWYEHCYQNEYTTIRNNKFSKAECDLAKLLLNNLDFSRNPIDNFHNFVCPNYNKTDKRYKRSSDDVEMLNMQRKVQSINIFNALKSTVQGFCIQKLKKGGLFLMANDRVLSYLRTEFGMFITNITDMTPKKNWTEFGIAEFWKKIGRVHRQFLPTDMLIDIIMDKIILNRFNNKPMIALMQPFSKHRNENEQSAMELFNLDISFINKIKTEPKTEFMFVWALRSDVLLMFEALTRKANNLTVLEKLKSGRNSEVKNYWKLGELNNKFKYVDLASFLEGFGVENVTQNLEIYVHNFDYLLQMDELFTLVEPQYVLDFLGMRIILKLKNIALESAEDCISSNINSIHDENHYFMEKLNLTEAYWRIEGAKKIGEKIFSTTKKLLNESRQIGDGFRQRALEKIHSMKHIYGWPIWQNSSSHVAMMLQYADYVDEFSKFPLSPSHPDYYFHTYLALNAVKIRQFLRPLQHTPEQIEEEILRSVYILSKSTYLAKFNKLFIPYGQMITNTFRPDFDPAIQFGTLGLAIGHEIGHAFDSDSFAFTMEQNGTALNYINMDIFEPNTTQKIDELNACLVNRYERECCMGVSKKICVNGMEKLDENFADLFGIHVAYNAYLDEKKKSNKTFHGLPGISNLSQNQLFWIGHGLSFCSTHASDLLLIRSSDSHPPDQCRINILLQNIPEFGVDFGCSLAEVDDDKAWMCKKKECNLWI